MAARIASSLSASFCRGCFSSVYREALGRTPQCSIFQFQHDITCATEDIKNTKPKLAHKQRWGNEGSSSSGGGGGGMQAGAAGADERATKVPASNKSLKIISQRLANSNQNCNIMQVLRAGCSLYSASLYRKAVCSFAVWNVGPILSLLVCEVRDKIRVRLQVEGVEQNL